MRTTFTKYLTTALATSALALSAQATLAQGGQAPAQGGGAPQQMPQQQPQQVDVDDATVDNFVDAYTDVREIHSEYAQRLQETSDTEEAQDLQQEAQAKMEEAVTSNDITVEEYQQISQQVGQDADLRERIQERLDSQS